MLTQDDLKKLTTVSGPCLSIFQPLRDGYPGVANTKGRITSAIQEADRLLAEKGFDPKTREAMLQPILEAGLSVDPSELRGSLVVFRGPEFVMVEFLEDTLPHIVHFGQEFLVLPILPGLLRQHDFWLLALSIKAVKLYRGSRRGLVEVDLPPGVPASLEEYEDFDQPDRGVRNQSSAGRSVGNMKAVQFGTGSISERQTDYLYGFFKAIDRGIRSILVHDRQPLILAGVTRELSIYRQTNTYSPALAGAIHGSPDILGVDFIFQRATELMVAYGSRAESTIRRRMEDAAGHHLLVSDPAIVFGAAHAGQVAELVLSPTVRGFEQVQNALNKAALATIHNSGRISILDSVHLGTGVAAILRFRPEEPVISFSAAAGSL